MVKEKDEEGECDEGDGRFGLFSLLVADKKAVTAGDSQGGTEEDSGNRIMWMRLWRRREADLLYKAINAAVFCCHFTLKVKRKTNAAVIMMENRF